jgi:DNA processing protein
MSEHALRLALTAFAALRTPSKIAEELRTDGKDGLDRLWHGMSATLQDRVSAEASSLAGRGIGVVFFGDDAYPARLVLKGKPAAPVIFYMGNLELAHRPGIGMCGSRAVSELGLKAARGCGEVVSRRGMVVISGYAKGVDTETHLAALRSGGATVIVLAEGFEHFRVKRSFADDFDPARVLVLSQFPPSQPWQAHAAMSRNSLIFGLGLGLVVIEAGTKGGTLAAGEGALKIGRPVIVLDFGDVNPEGNQLLIERGGHAVTSWADLVEAVTSLHVDDSAPLPEELPFEQARAL